MSTTAFYSPGEFAFTAALEHHWERIYAEFLAVEHQLSDYVERKLYDEGWQVFGLWNLPHREPLQGMQSRCPFTYALIESLIPSHGAVAFSVLQPGTVIKPHTGAPGQFLRCHLGLEVPDGDCALTVGGEIRAWDAGRALVFDDRLEHAAWNRTPARRVVLLLDFLP
ncbi:aspartyl/asparaginyl beta-hydroxylase domain-containing protein [Duganella sp. PWIR1]